MLTVFTVIGLVLLLVLLVWGALSWWRGGDFFSFWLGWQCMDGAMNVLGMLLEILAKAFSKSGD